MNPPGAPMPDLLKTAAGRWLVLGVLVAGGVWWITRQGAARNIAAGLAEGAAGAVIGAAEGAVVGIGRAIGVPETNHDQCTVDLANGDYWAASFSCPAARFIENTTSGPDFDVRRELFRRNG